MSARDVAVWGALAVAVANGLVGLFGALRWYRFAPSREFWLGLRSGQALALAYAVIVAVLVLGNDPPSSSLYYLYALLPVAIGFVAEQLRLVAADQVLSARELDDAQQVATLPAAQQQAIVTAILFAVLAFKNPETAKLFASMVQHGPATVSPAITPSVAVRGEIADAFRAAFLTIAGFTSLGFVLSLTIPMRRI